MSGGVLPQPPELEAPGRIWPASDPAQDGGSLHIPTLCTLLLDFPWGSPPPLPHAHTRPEPTHVTPEVAGDPGLANWNTPAPLAIMIGHRMGISFSDDGTRANQSLPEICA